MKIAKIHGIWGGIYEWGKGFVDTDKYQQWESFWSTYKGIFWGSVKLNDSMNTRYLVSTYGNVYLHPMDFTCYLSNVRDIEYLSDGKMEQNEIDIILDKCSVIEELNECCNEVAKYCGGTFKLEISLANVDFAK